MQDLFGENTMNNANIPCFIHFFFFPLHRNNEYTLNLLLYRLNLAIFYSKMYKLLGRDKIIENLWLYKSFMDYEYIESVHCV